MKSLIIRIFKQIKYDKRLLALIFAAPILILTLIYFLLGQNSSIPKLGVINVSDTLVNGLKEEKATIIKLKSINDINKSLKNKTIDAAIYIDKNILTLKLLDNDISTKSNIVKVIQDASGKINPSNNMNVLYLYGKNNGTLFESISYIMLGFISFFFIFILSGISFIRERSQGTLERFVLSPIKRWQIIVGYTIAYGVLAIMQSIIIILYCEYVLGIHIGSGIFLAMIIMMFMAITAVSIGILISTISNNEFQVVQFIPIIVLPQLFLSGLIPVDAIPYGIGKIAYFMPLYYACDALKEVVIYRNGITSILLDLGILAFLICILSVVNTMILKIYRKI